MKWFILILASLFGFMIFKSVDRESNAEHFVKYYVATGYPSCGDYSECRISVMERATGRETVKMIYVNQKPVPGEILRGDCSKYEDGEVSCKLKATGQMQQVQQ